MQTLSLQWAVLVALGGASGALARGVTAALWATRFPWATMLINVLGSFAIGLIIARTNDPSSTHANWRALLATGFCGGFTTFSTFSWQTLELLETNRTPAAIANVVLTLTLCLTATYIGFRIARA
jgi:CrcB protein